MPHWEVTTGRGRSPKWPIPPEPGSSALALLSQYLAVSTAHDDRVEQLHWQVAHDAYAVRARELSHSIVDFYVAPLSKRRQ